MPHSRPFRFGATGGKTPSGKAWRELARKAESLGYSSLFLPDHFNDQVSPLPALAMAAEATERLRVGTLVICNDFRHPAMLAKELATIDLLSDGRVEWGMGAGWFPFDFESTDLSFDPPGIRVERLAEAVSVMKGLFGQQPVDHRGVHYRIEGLNGTPKPVQTPHPPLLIGAAQRRLLSLAGREADIVGVAPSLESRSLGTRPPLMTVTAAADRQLEWVRTGAGPRFERIELQMTAFPAIVGGDVKAHSENAAKPFGLEPSEVLASPQVLLGSVEQICDLLEERRARWGVSYWVVATDAVEKFSPVVDRMVGR